MALVLDEWSHARNWRNEIVAAISRGETPSRVDLRKALIDIPGEPVPRELIDHIISTHLKSSRKPPGSYWSKARQTRDFLASLYYRMVAQDLRSSEESEEVKTKALERTAEAFRVSTKTVRRALAKHAK